MGRYAKFSARVANKPFGMSDFEDFQTHFTAMGMLGEGEIGAQRGEGARRDPESEEFRVAWEAEHSAPWSSVLASVDAAVRRIFEAVRHVYPGQPHPTGVPLSPNAAWSLEDPNQGQGVALYGLDVMVMKDLSVRVLEVQWAPDTALIDTVDDEFWNRTLAFMFLGEEGREEKGEEREKGYVLC